MSRKAYLNVFDAIEDDPGIAENLRLRALLMIRLELQIKQHKWTQTEAARRLGVTQPRISNLLRGKIELFSLDMLVEMATAAGLRVELRIAKAA